MAWKCTATLGIWANFWIQAFWQDWVFCFRNIYKYLYKYLHIYIHTHIFPSRAARVGLPVCSGGVIGGVCWVSLILSAEGSVTLDQHWLQFQPPQTIRSQPRLLWLVFALGRALHTELMVSGEIRAFFTFIYMELTRAIHHFGKAKNLGQNSLSLESHCPMYIEKMQIYLMALWKQIKTTIVTTNVSDAQASQQPLQYLLTREGSSNSLLKASLERLPKLVWRGLKTIIIN